MRFKMIVLFHIIFITMFSQTEPTIEWSHTYSSGSGKSIEQTESDDFIIVGHNGYTPWAYGDLYYLKIDSDGNEIWSNINTSAYGVANAIIKTNSSEFYITGNRNNNNFIEKINSSGDSLFLNTFTSEWFGNSVDIAQDSSILICGEGVYGFVMKVDDYGTPIWEYEYPDASHVWGNLQNSYCDEVKFLSNGNIMIGGYYESWFVEQQLNSNYLIKADSEGNELWFIEFTNYFNTYSNPSKFIITPSEEFVMIARGNEVYKISSDGNEIWCIDDINTSCRFQEIKSIITTTEIYYYIIGNVTGPNYSHPCLVKIDDNGNVIWEQTYESDDDDRIYDFHVTDDDGFLLVGSSNSQMYVMKLSNENSNIDDNEMNHIPLLMQNHPNPFNPSTKIDFYLPKDSNVNLLILNIKGQKIKTLIHNDLSKGSHSIIWNGDDDFNNSVTSGVYLYKLDINGKTEAVKKCLLLK